MLRIPALCVSLFAAVHATAQAPRLLKDFEPGSRGSFGQILDLNGQTLVELGQKLWVTDGTAVGTVAITGTLPPSIIFHTGFPARYYGFSDQLAFSCFPLETNCRWVSVPYPPYQIRQCDLVRRAFFTDGTSSGSRIVQAPANTFSSLQFYSAVALGRELITFGPRHVGSNSYWNVGVTDGTAQGSRVIQAFPDSVGPVARLGGRVLFNVKNGAYTTDGITTTKILDGQIRNHVVLDRRVLFPRWDATHGEELWSTDGSKTGTSLLVDLVSGPGSSRPQLIGVIGYRALFLRDDLTNKWDLWTTDGTANGTKKVTSLAGGGCLQKHTMACTTIIRGGPTIQGRVLFVMSTPVLTSTAYFYKNVVMSSDGTANGTVTLATFDATTDFEVVGSSRAFFAAAQGSSGANLWQTDGTVAGTTRVSAALKLGTLVTNDPIVRWRIHSVRMTHSAGKLYFAADDGKVGDEIWVLDLRSNTQPIGLGCGGPIGGGTRLAADDPILGKSGTIRLSGATPSASGALFLTAAGSSAIPIGFGCTLFIDPGKVAAIAALKTDVRGAAQVPFQVPNNSSLIGQGAAVQAAVTNSAVPPLGLELSNGVLMFIGR